MFSRSNDNAQRNGPLVWVGYEQPLYPSSSFTPLPPASLREASNGRGELEGKSSVPLLHDSLCIHQMIKRTFVK